MMLSAQLQWAQDHLGPVVLGLCALGLAATRLAGRRRGASGRRRPLVDLVADLSEAAAALLRARMTNSFMNSCDLPAADRDEVNRRLAEGIAGVNHSAGARTLQSGAPRRPERRQGRHARQRRDEK